MPPDEPLELFERERQGAARPEPPLADRMRPRSLDEVVGQAHLIGPGAPLRTLVESGALPSLILWGPPGSGKTTLARLLAGGAHAPDARGVRFVALSAVRAGVKDVRTVAERAARERAGGVRTVLFLDEIHRFHRGQQDALLPHVEDGTVTLLGATTENPSFELVPPLLSRCRVFVLERLDEAALATLVDRAMADPERGLGASGARLDEEARGALVAAADGDARRALGLLEASVALWRRTGDGNAPLSAALVGEAAGRPLLLHDRDREEHYNVVSALIKSLRASDPDAALYWLARLLEAGEDPTYVARRLVIFASEDVGNAEPQALPLATAAHLAAERIGMPEARIPLAQAVTFLACAPKSRASYAALEEARRDARERGSLPVPLHLRNAPTALMRELGYGRADPGASNLPEALGARRYYEPGRAGAERTIAERRAGQRADED